MNAGNVAFSSKPGQSHCFDETTCCLIVISVVEWIIFLVSMFDMFKLPLILKVI